MARSKSNKTFQQTASGPQTEEAALYMIHHVFLPPKLPQEEDFSAGLDGALVDMVIDSLHKFNNLQDQYGTAGAVLPIAENYRAVHDEHGHISQARLEETLAALLNNEPSIVALQVGAQNSGLIVRGSRDGVLFEVFELSPDNKSVVSTKGRLVRSFPAFVVSVSRKEFLEPGFLAVLSQTLSKMSAERVDEMQPKVAKAGEAQSEERDTAIPHLVTEHLASFLQAVGAPVAATSIRKHTREEVMWKDAKSPWRRCQTWLLLRVAMQLTFSRLSVDASKSLYKPFMIFLMSQILKLALTHPCIESDIIYAMNAKLTQRLQKVEGYEDKLWFRSAENAIIQAQSYISSRWDSVMASSCQNIDLSALREVKPAEDIIHQIPHLDRFLCQIQSLSTPAKHKGFKARGRFPFFDADRLPSLAHVNLDSLNQSFALAAFETWVELHLQTWLDRHVDVENTCVALKELIEAYHNMASTVYRGNPEALSLMVLTVMDLWVACDQAACRLYELLKQHDHEIDPSLLGSLLLPLKSQLDRVSNIESYFETRSVQINKSFVSPFRNFGHRRSFAVQYFDQSPQHQLLLRKIEDRAHQQKANKIQELTSLNLSYKEVMRCYESSCCENIQVTEYDIDGLPYETTQHSHRCQKCNYLRRAKNMHIHLHEWPVSLEPNRAKATVFELAVPPDFGAWRDVTQYTLQRVLGCKYEAKSPTNSDFTLKKDAGIRQFYHSNHERVGIRSHTKPSTSTHRNPVSIPSTENAVCLANGLTYAYYDFKEESLIIPLTITSDLNEQCTFVLPTRSKPLQRYLKRTATEPDGPEPNEVIASLSECPDAMSLDEFRSFAMIPLGCKIQWHNILCQLAVPSIDLTKVDTLFLLLQVSQQIGPKGESPARLSHEVLRRERFSLSLLAELREAKRRIGENWESFHALTAFVCLAARLLASTPFPNIESDCLSYLESCRALLSGWVKQLRAKVESCTDDAQRAEFAARVVEIALACMSSFAVAREHLRTVLSLTGSACIFLQCSIAIQEHLTSINLSQSSAGSIFLARWRQLMYAACPVLIEQIVNVLNPCLDLTVQEFWVDYVPGSAWQQLPVPHQHWLQSSTFNDDEKDSCSIHFNLLTAELLVNGTPLAKLPAQYEKHASYSTLFGQSHIQVMPSSRPGFDFSARCEYASHLVDFGFLGDDLLLHAVNGEFIYDLVPARLLSGIVPQAFVEDYVHWFDHQLRAVIFVLKHNPWSREPLCWRVSSKAGGWLLTNGKQTIVNMRSLTGQVIADILSPLEDSLFIHILCPHGSKNVEVDLPRLRLGFSFETGNDTMLSRQFQGMSIDHSQNVGTLFGLTSKLVLRSETGARCVLIPEGSVSYRRQCGHVSISIRRGVSRIHSYCVDDQLGRFLGSGSMQSMLLLCYLHGLTSYCLPDPLTSLTGTEQALTIITSAAVRSFDILDQENLSMLELISQLAPKRLFYPPHLQEMQTVHWNPELSFMSQHSQLYVEVQDIFAQATRSKPLYPEFVDPPSLDWTKPHLLERELIRSATFRVSGFGAEHHTDNHDVCYQQRDRGQRSDRALRTYVVARSIFDRKPVLHNHSLTSLKGYLWRRISVQEPIPGPQTILTHIETSYGGILLGNTAKYLASKWCSTHASLSRGSEMNRYRLMMWLSTTAFAQEADMLLIETLVACYCIPAIAQIAPPCHTIFTVREGMSVKNVAASINFKPMNECPEARLAPLPKESAARTRARQRQALQSKQSKAENSFVGLLEVQWPCERPTRPTSDIIDAYIELEASMANIEPRWRVWWQNFRFHNYLNDIETELKAQSVHVLSPAQGSFLYTEISHRNAKHHIRNEDLFNLPPPQIPNCFADDLAWMVQKRQDHNYTSAPLETLSAALEDRVSANHEQHYLDDLRDSISHLYRDYQTYQLAISEPGHISKLLQHHRDECRKRVKNLFGGLSQLTNRGLQIAATASHAPRTSPQFYLQQLSHSRWQSLSDDWKRSLVSYARCLRALQRAERLIKSSNNPIELCRELLNIGEQNWDPMTFPDWLLLEVDSGLLMREEQANIAKHMLAPRAGRNAVMQLNMGEGKSTFIVPAIAATLADRQSFVRVFVARPQSKQMFQMLVSKLGGLLGRRIYHMPISRSLQLGLAEAESLRATFAECMKNGGILLVQPEHVLSMKLMAVESILNDDLLLGQSLLKSLHFFNTKSRDIIDESDENFSVKFELIYTMGLQQPIELSPDRWIVIQHILGLVARFAPQIAIAIGVDKIEVEGRRGRFPKTRILQPEAGLRLRLMIAQHICESGLVGFPVTHQSAEMRQAILHYITRPNLEPEELSKIEDGNSTVWSSSTRGHLLLIRGLLAGGVLDFVLGAKRWRVNYGLHPLRIPPTKLAVPFRAKDCPSLRSEFSHPDVVIMLTSLSYYYGGISDEDLFDSFQLLLRADQADVEYRIWSESAPDLPKSFRHLSGINLKDRRQCVEQIFPALRFSRGAIDYFLSHCVFQKYIKEFPYKISASGWDLGQVKSKPTTGFSGTIDSRHLLPLDINHVDLDPQRHTNALVLKNILEPENSVHILPSKSPSTRDECQVSNAEMLLQTVKAMQPVVRVILDVGAQILEFNNEQVAGKWLDILEDTQETEAAVFFNENNELSVLDRKGQVELLQVSPYASRLDVCLVFLDEAHTRGTDLKLPANYRAAVTLGPNLTKDRLVQACMRMRKLGKGQSLVFCVSAEIKTKIQKVMADTSSPIGVSDVLGWCISETFVDHRRCMLLWAMQGHRHVSQSETWEAASGNDCITLSKERAERFLEDEIQDLEDRYRPRTTQTKQWNKATQNERVTRIIQRCHEFNVLSSESASLEEEQEKELQPEIVRERELNKPAPAQALNHSLHRDLLSLVTTGKMVENSQSLLPAFQTLQTTTAAECYDILQFPGDLLVTADFSRTVRLKGGKCMTDSFLRPVQWILTCTHDPGIMIMIIISPFEAQKLLPNVRKYKKVTLHNYLPRPSLQFRPLDSLDLFTEGRAFDSSTIPPQLRIQLNLFSGQLYLSTFEEYTAVCDFLGLAWQPREHEVDVAIDGFIVSINTSRFTRSPVQFLYLLMTKLRRDCDSIEKTHMGRILNGVLLEKADFAA